MSDEKTLKDQPSVGHVENFDSLTWLNAKDAARYLRTSVGQIRNLVYQGRIIRHGEKFGRLLFRRADLDRLIASPKGGRQ